MAWADMSRKKEMKETQERLKAERLEKERIEKEKMNLLLVQKKKL